MEKDGLLEEYRNYNPEKDPSGAYGISLTNRIIARYGSIERVQEILSKMSKKTKSIENKVNEDEVKSNKLKFIQFSDNMQLNPDRVFDNRKDKENLIRRFGYPQLYTGYYEGKQDYLSKLTDAQIGNLFKRTYYSIKDKLSK